MRTEKQNVLRWMLCLLCATMCMLTGCRQSSDVRSAAKVPAAVMLDAPCLKQHPDFPTGCETFAAVMALQYFGESITPDTFLDSYLEKSNDFYHLDRQLYGPDPAKVFVGDPRSANGYGCFAPVIRRALVRYFGSADRVIDTTGMDIPTLCRTYINAGLPVILWATSNMKPLKAGNSWLLSDGTVFVWPAGEHCLLLVGYSEKYYYFNDSNEGETVPYLRSIVEQRYADMGMQSLVISKKELLSADSSSFCFFSGCSLFSAECCHRAPSRRWR